MFGVYLSFGLIANYETISIMILDLGAAIVVAEMRGYWRFYSQLWSL
jgi:hypothetical protein